MIKLALTDLDNTLIAFGNERTSERGIEAFHAMMDAGLHVGPVTGRVPAAMRWMFRGDEACARTGAYVNGMIVYVDGEPIRTETIPGELLNGIGDFIRDIDGAALAVCDLDRVTGSSDGEISYLGATAEELARHDAFFGWSSYNVVDHLDWKSAIKTNLRCDLPSEQTVALRDELCRAFPELDFVFPLTGGPFIDIVPAGWGKGQAVELLIECLGVTPDEVVAFGDSENDLAMLRAVGNPVAVGNAAADVKAASKWVLADACEDPVPDALFDIAHAAVSGRMPAFMD
ncbi:MAG: HAD family phosphatase [Atopobiaceae bacterium]|nr:HAD family phosphatase [Atopobiaceae bacterium]